MTVDVVDTSNEPAGSGGGSSSTVTAIAAGSPQPAAPAARREWALRPLLFLADATTLFAGWGAAVFLAHHGVKNGLWAGTQSVTVAICATVAGLLTAVMSRLYRARVCAVRTVEVELLGRVTVVSALFALLAESRVGVNLSAAFILVSAACVFVLLNVERGIFAIWVRTHRAQGRYARPVVIIGSNDEARELNHLLATEPELGYQVVGVIGDPDDSGADWPVPWLGDASDAVEIVRQHGITGCVVAVSAFSLYERTTLLRELLDDGIHVQLSSGIARIDHHRLRVVPLGRESAFYLERHDPAAWQLRIKRALDLSLVILTAPFVLLAVGLAAIAIKLDSRGPIIYRQQRIGRGGKPFTIYKLRTMVVEADKQLDQLAQNNERTDGPLFKLDQDPRVTRVGRLLRATSIDELPQLWCVLTGTMSLVGPRPPLQDEVEQFDPELQSRFDVAPGITGLWQVEARDNPSFHAYRRYDLFYVENWSVRLDIAILVRTFEAVVTRAFVGFKHDKSEESPENREDAEAA